MTVPAVTNANIQPTAPVSSQPALPVDWEQKFPIIMKLGKFDDCYCDPQGHGFSCETFYYSLANKSLDELKALEEAVEGLFTEHVDRPERADIIWNLFEKVSQAQWLTLSKDIQKLTNIKTSLGDETWRCDILRVANILTPMVNPVFREKFITAVLGLFSKDMSTNHKSYVVQGVFELCKTTEELEELQVLEPEAKENIAKTLTCWEYIKTMNFIKNEHFWREKFGSNADVLLFGREIPGANSSNYLIRRLATGQA